MAAFVWDNNTKKMSVTLAQQLQSAELAINIIGTSETITGPILTSAISTRYQTIADLSYRPTIQMYTLDGTKDLSIGRSTSNPIQYLEGRSRGIYKTFNLDYTFIDLIPGIPAVSLTATTTKDTTLKTLTLNGIFGTIEAPITPASYLLYPVSFKDETIKTVINKPTFKGVYGSIEAPTIAVSQQLVPISFKDETIKTILNRPTVKSIFGTIEAPTIAVSQELKISKIYQPTTYKLLSFDSFSLEIGGIDYFDVEKYMPVLRPKYKFIKSDYQCLFSSSTEYLERGLEQLYVANKKLTKNPQKDTRGQLGLKVAFDIEIGGLTYYFSHSLKDDRTIVNDHDVKQQFFTFNPKKIKYHPGWETGISPTNVNAGIRDIQVLTNPITYTQKWK